MQEGENQQDRDGRSSGSYFQRGARGAQEDVASRTAEKQARFFLPHLSQGMRLLDCGCGPGTITTGLARIVSPGEVVGVDNGAEQIEIANKQAAESGTSNVTFQVASIYEMPFPSESFDAVFVHNVLEHLAQPQDALKEVYRVLKPGGVVGVRDVEADGILSSPDNPAFKKSVEVFVQVWESFSGSPRMGKHLRSMLQDGGFTDVQASATFEHYGPSDHITPESLKRICDLTADRFRTEQRLITRAKELGIADDATLEEYAQAWNDLGNDPNGFFGNAHCQAVGWKSAND